VTQHNNEVQLGDEEVFILKTALEYYIQKPDGCCLFRPYAKSALNKIKLVDKESSVSGRYFSLGLGEYTPIFTEGYGTRENGIRWAVRKGLSPTQANKLYDKVQAYGATHVMDVTERRKMFIDEVEFYLDF
jgi:hypothetical protein